MSHTFIQREVLGLRARGVRVETITVRRPPTADLLTDADRSEAAQTFAILPASPARLVALIARAAATRPRRLGRLLWEALRAGRGAVRETLWQFFYVAEAIIVWDHCRRLGIRHLHAHFANVGADLCMAAASLGGSGWMWTFTMHGSTEFYDRRAHRLAEKTASAARVICISDFCRSQMMYLLPASDWDKLEMIHCGIDPEQFAPPQRDGRAAGRLRIVCVSRLVIGKGLQLLLDAMVLLESRGIDVHLDLVGDGPERGPLAASAVADGLDGRVRFHGSTAADRIPEHIARADVFCLPSFAEGVPVVLMEAMAMRTPVVSTAIMGIPELVEDGVSGYLVRPGRADQLADALMRIALMEPAERDRMGEAGRARVVDQFDISDSVARVAALFDDLADAR